MVGTDTADRLVGHGIDEFLTDESAQGLRQAIEQANAKAVQGQLGACVPLVSLELPLLEGHSIAIAAQIRTHRTHDGKATRQNRPALRPTPCLITTLLII